MRCNTLHNDICHESIWCDIHHKHQNHLICNVSRPCGMSQTLGPNWVIAASSDAHQHFWAPVCYGPERPEVHHGSASHHSCPRGGGSHAVPPQAPDPPHARRPGSDKHTFSIASSGTCSAKTLGPNRSTRPLRARSQCAPSLLSRPRWKQLQPMRHKTRASVRLMIWCHQIGQGTPA